ncbi:unnamed protein product [Auanema sp. JU1783]|nr:unnamed protein product [Auanema sp. JU1783]
MFNFLFTALLILSLAIPAWSTDELVVYPSELEIALSQTANITFESKIHLEADVYLSFNQTYGLELQPVVINKTSGKGVLTIRGKELTSRSFIEVDHCQFLGNQTGCPFDVSNIYVQVAVYKSHVIDWLVHIVGWLYFFAWSISFYPQIFLNFKRKSVIGLNFDFLFLNLIGFIAYSCYNLLIYFDPVVQSEYEAAHPRSPIPVLLNDVVFAVHAAFACLVTVVQCFLYERANQRVSRTASIIGVLLIIIGIIMGSLSTFKIVSILVFVNSLSYLKMSVTLMKYFPQAIFNFQRKSTVGWSIGNVLLDFTGGSLDIFQMCLQGFNVNDWSAFYGNPVKFGLGLVSIIFDVVFIIQHYILYRSSEITHDDYAGIESSQPHPDYSPNEDDHTAIVTEN